MRDDRSSYSLDMRGVAFATKTIAGVVILFGAVQYGTTRASEYILSTGADTITQSAAVQVTTLPAHPLESALTAYEDTLAARSTGAAAFDTLVSARARMLGIKHNSLILLEDGKIVETIPLSRTGRIPTGLSVAHTDDGGSDVFATISFPGCTISGPLPDRVPCITVTSEHAARIAAFVGTGVPLFVTPETGATSTPPTRALPRVSAKAFIIADLASGTVFAAKDAEAARPIASISKLFTAIVARETIRDDRTMTVTREDQSHTEGVPGSIRAGESFTVDELLYPLLMESNNSAAYTLARYEGTEQFIERVNQKVNALGMNATTLDDPSGLSANNKSSPRDLVTLLQHIQQYHSLLFEITGARTKTLRAENGRTYSFSNFNHFAGDEGFVGGKTGFIAEAGQTYAGVFDITTETGTSTIAIVVLGSEDRKKDTAALLSWFRDR